MKKSTNECVQLPENCMKLNSVNKCVECNPGYMPVSNGTCIEIPLCTLTNCLACNIGDNNKCIECEKGYLLSENVCVQCSIDNCSVCRNSKYCSKCNDGFYQFGGSCQYIKTTCDIANCTTCSFNGENCSRCEDN